jgi:CRISPR-associated protein Cas1
MSTANSYLYAVCQAALLSVGYSPALGFVHTGKPLSFVYDIADLYKMETTVPAAFEAIRDADLDGVSIRAKCRQKFTDFKLMKRIVKDVDQLLGYRGGDLEVPTVGYLWDDKVAWVEGGKDY